MGDGGGEGQEGACIVRNPQVRHHAHHGEWAGHFGNAGTLPASSTGCLLKRKQPGCAHHALHDCLEVEGGAHAPRPAALMKGSLS